MNKKLSLEEISEVVAELKGNILIVEGKKDERALRSLGMYSGCSRLKPRGSTCIIRINSRPVAKVAQDAVSMAEKHKNREVIVLTDFDRTGRRLAAKIRLLLQSRNIHANYRIRRDVMNLGIKRMEELASLSRGLEQEEGRWHKRMKAQRRLPTKFRLQSKGRGISVFRKKERDDYGEIGADFNKVRDKGLHKGKRDCRKTRCDRGDIRAD